MRHHHLATRALIALSLYLAACDGGAPDAVSPDASGNDSDAGTSSDDSGLHPDAAPLDDGVGKLVQLGPYTYGPDSAVQAGVPQGTITRHEWNTSTALPGTTRSYWVYVPAQYTAGTPAALLVVQDGAGAVRRDGAWRYPNVLDNLIARGELPVTIAIFITPGARADGASNRGREYNALDDAYTRLVIDEIVPAVAAQYDLTTEPDRRMIGGHSSGAIAAFTVAWRRPDQFRRVLTANGSFVNINRPAGEGGDTYPARIRNEAVRPLRVFLQSGSGDLDNQFGSWPEANEAMSQALADRGYPYRFVFGDGTHAALHAASILPETLRWLAR